MSMKKGDKVESFGSMFDRLNGLKGVVVKVVTGRGHPNSKTVETQVTVKLTAASAKKFGEAVAILDPRNLRHI